MSKITKNQLLESGWTEEQISCLAGKPYTHNSKNEPAWEKFLVKKIENFLSFKTFTTAEDFYQRQQKVALTLEEKTKKGIETIEKLNVEFEEHNCLLKNIDKYNPLEPIFHQTSESFNPTEEHSYTLFTDGCFKQIGQKSFASCAGWILDNESQKIIIEFTKVVELNPEKTRNMPEFELTGIYEGVNAIKTLGLKNVQCYTDSIGEAQIILSAMNGLGERRLNKLADIYQPILDILKETNSTIAWVPRECNTHADALTKIPLNAWLEEYKKTHLESDYIKENGYIIDREKEIYLHIDEIEFNPIETSENKFSIITYYKQFREFTFLHNNEDDNLQLLNVEKRNFNYISEDLEDKIILIKKTKPDGANIMHLIKGLEFVKDISKINLTAPPGVIAVCKKLTPINAALQEEYFEFHKAIKNFPGKINLTSLEPKMLKKVNTYIEKYIENEKTNGYLQNLVGIFI